MTEQPAQNPPHLRVSDADALMLAMHAMHVQGGASDPERERARAEAQMAQTGVPIDFAKMRAELHVAYAQQRAAEAIDHESRQLETYPSGETVAAPVTVLAEPGTDLALALEQYAQAKAERDEAAERYDDVKARIKACMDSQPPGTEQVIVRDPSGSAPPLSLKWSTSRRVDTTRMKRDHPAFVEAYTKESAPSLGLTEVGSKGGRS